MHRKGGFLNFPKTGSVNSQPDVLDRNLGPKVSFGPLRASALKPLSKAAFGDQVPDIKSWAKPFEQG